MRKIRKWIDTVRTGDVKTLQTMIDSGFNIQDNDGDTALMNASGNEHKDIVELLISHGKEMMKRSFKEM